MGSVLGDPAAGDAALSIMDSSSWTRDAVGADVMSDYSGRQRAAAGVARGGAVWRTAGRRGAGAIDGGPCRRFHPRCRRGWGQSRAGAGNYFVFFLLTGRGGSALITDEGDHRTKKKTFSVFSFTSFTDCVFHHWRSFNDKKVSSLLTLLHEGGKQ
jgi:hypothetical protein